MLSKSIITLAIMAVLGLASIAPSTAWAGDRAGFGNQQSQGGSGGFGGSGGRRY